MLYVFLLLLLDVIFLGKKPIRALIWRPDAIKSDACAVLEMTRRKKWAWGELAPSRRPQVRPKRGKKCV